MTEQLLAAIALFCILSPIVVYLVRRHRIVRQRYHMALTILNDDQEIIEGLTRLARAEDNWEKEMLRRFERDNKRCRARLQELREEEGLA